MNSALKRFARSQRGQASIEYVVVGGLLAAALFAVEFDGRTAAQYLSDAVRAFFQNITYFISLP